MDNKNINDICIIVQARMGSQRVPGKMLKSFADTTLTDILFDKLTKSTIIPKSNIYFSAYEDELKEVGRKYGINVFDRSKESAFAETDMKLIYEWHDKLPFKYVVLVSACNPLLTIETIDGFLKSFIESDKEGAFAVFEKKTYYWDKQGKPITNWQGVSIMNTKNVEPIYEAAHCLYASRLDIIEQGYWMDINYPPQPQLFIMEELEAFDIDYNWQFHLGEQLFKMGIC
jgi:CMP-N-acetylneuraminic acid synthetase